jgi:predicted SnoaL-like aldol condensation-catalyzing enzyme
MPFREEDPMPSAHKQQVIELLTSIETGDEKPLAYINPSRYIQHNLAVGDGVEGFVARMKGPGERVCQGKYRARLEDGDFVFTHTEYTFAIGHRVGFDIFRFENGKMVEHWDNL